MEKRTPRTPRAAPANLPIGVSDSRPRNNFGGCRPRLIFQNAGSPQMRAGCGIIENNRYGVWHRGKLPGGRSKVLVSVFFLLIRRILDG